MIWLIIGIIAILFAIALTASLVNAIASERMQGETYVFYGCVIIALTIFGGASIMSVF